MKIDINDCVNELLIDLLIHPSYRHNHFDEIIMIDISY